MKGPKYGFFTIIHSSSRDGLEVCPALRARKPMKGSDFGHLPATPQRNHGGDAKKSFKNYPRPGAHYAGGGPASRNELFVRRIAVSIGAVLPSIPSFPFTLLDSRPVASVVDEQVPGVGTRLGNFGDFYDRLRKF